MKTVTVARVCCLGIFQVALLSFAAAINGVTAEAQVRPPTPPGTRPPGQPPRNQPPGNQPPGNQPPGNQPPGNQPPGNQPPPPNATPIPGLSQDQLAEFQGGLREFTRPEDLNTGLGPVFNGRSCAECHAQGGVGGSSPDLGRSRVTRIARLLNGVFDPLENLGGSLLQARSVRELNGSLPVNGERVPPEATLVSRRITPPVFGMGLLEAIPDREILRRAGGLPGRPDGIAGAANWVRNPETGGMELGRFGWKSHVSTIHVFAAAAYQGELGITNPLFPDENLPQGQPIPPGADLVPGLEDDGSGVSRLTAFMRYLAPPVRRPASTQARAGERVFNAIGCANCHTQAMNTDGSSPIPALRNRRVELWSDLLLHDMGPGLADGMVMESANGRQWRTTPLWGLSGRRFFLHDGRATTLDAAIAAHGGEGSASAQRSAALSASDRSALLEFLKSL